MAEKGLKMRVLLWERVRLWGDHGHELTLLWGATRPYRGQRQAQEGVMGCMLLHLI